jgi:hypothetical protein
MTRVFRTGWRNFFERIRINLSHLGLVPGLYQGSRAFPALEHCNRPDTSPVFPSKTTDKDEFNRREVFECDGWVCVLEVIGVPSRLRLTREVSVLERVLTTFVLNCEENVARWKWKCPLFHCTVWIPDDAKKRSVSRWVWKNKWFTISLCNLPVVLGITDINLTEEIELGGLLL